MNEKVVESSNEVARQAKEQVMVKSWLLFSLGRHDDEEEEKQRQASGAGTMDGVMTAEGEHVMEVWLPAGRSKVSKEKEWVVELQAPAEEEEYLKLLSSVVVEHA
jgi:hypothetical protein